MNAEAQIRRLILWNQLWMGLWIFVSLAAISTAILSNQKAQMNQLHLRWVGDGSVKLSAIKEWSLYRHALGKLRIGKSSRGIAATHSDYRLRRRNHLGRNHEKTDLA